MTVKNDNLDKDKLMEQFLRIGLDERTARNTVANNKVTSNLNAVIHEVFSPFSHPLSVSVIDYSICCFSYLLLRLVCFWLRIERRNS